MKNVLVSLSVGCLMIMTIVAPLAADVTPHNKMLTKLTELETFMRDVQETHALQIKEMRIRIESLEQENKELYAYIDNAMKKQGTSIEDCKQALRDITISPEGIPQITEGLEIGMSATGLVQGIINSGNGMQGDATDATWTADLELTKEFEDCGRAYAHIEMGQGAGLDGDEVTFFSAINRDAGDTSARLEVTELYYEVILLDEHLLITAGKLDPTVYLDDNEIANDETTQFLSTAFRNATTIEFPDNNLGARLGARLMEGLYVNAGVLEDDGDYEDVGDGLFGFAQLAYTPAYINRPGTYRVYGWHDTSAHAALKDMGMTKEHNYGFGLSIDQEVLDSVIGFGRFGWADPHVSAVEYAWSAGLEIHGDGWRREHDYLGVAVGQNIPGYGLEKSGVTNHNEGQIEVYYNCQVYDHLAISPHMQLIWNPNGVADENTGASDSTVTIVGVRSQLDF